MCKKSIYTNTTWYDQGVYNAITALDAKYPNAIPVFGGAIGAYNAIESGDFDRFKVSLFNAVDNAKFFKWHESAADVARRFCHLCGIDPALIEVGFGAKFEEVFAV